MAAPGEGLKDLTPDAVTAAGHEGVGIVQEKNPSRGILRPAAEGGAMGIDRIAGVAATTMAAMVNCLGGVCSSFGLNAGRRWRHPRR